MRHRLCPRRRQMLTERLGRTGRPSAPGRQPEEDVYVDDLDVPLGKIGDAAGCAKAGQTVPHGHYNIEAMLSRVAAHGGEVGICGTCLDARGMTDAELAGAAHRSSLDELATWAQWTDRTLVF